jgi:tetratricopeptide (TPR) repeat protein
MNLPLMWLPLLPVLVVLLIPDTAAAQAGGKASRNSRISVQVQFPDGSAAHSGVLVELELQNTQMVTQDQTDSSGRCAFAPTAPAIYLVRAKEPGYFDAVESVNLQATPTGTAHLVLRPKPGEAPAPPPKNAGGHTISAINLAVSEPARKEYNLGQHSLENHDLDGGVAHLQKAIGLYDQYPQAYTLLGMVYNEQKKWKDAQAALEKAVQQDAKGVEAYFQLGACLNQQKDFTGAVKSLNQGLQLNQDAPDAAAANYELARAYLALGQWQDANPHAAKAVAMLPDVASWHILMGNIDLKKGDGQGAISEFQAYLKLDPHGPAAASIHDMIPKIQMAMAKK